LKSFERFLSLLATIPDPRRAEGKRYQLQHVLLFSILAIISGANSYRGIRTFLVAHRKSLNKAFKLNWKTAPTYTGIRYILQGLSATEVEKVFRAHAANLNRGAPDAVARVIAFDGETLKGSFDNFNDIKARQVLGAFAVDTALVLAHVEIDEKIQRNPRRAKAVGGTRRGRPYCHVRRDALSKKPFIAAAAANAHLIVQLKDNQPILSQHILAACAAATPLSGARTVDSKRRGRHETRTVALFDAKPMVASTE
jgi:hypothetical protein